MIRVLVVDDSAFMRTALSTMLAKDPDIEVVGTARHGAEALDMVQRLDPDVVTMDVDMPVMDGITAVRQIMAQSPRPILMVSSLTREGAHETLQALDAGAVDFIPKDLARVSLEIIRIEADLQAKVKAIARTHKAKTQGPTAPSPILPRIPNSVNAIAMGVSTGGPPVVQRILAALPASFPAPIFVAQHMPGAFTGPFAERLNASSALEVCEAQDGMPVVSGRVYVGPGGMHLRVRRHGVQVVTEVSPEPRDALYKPSATELIASIAQVYGSRGLALILTGMGSDGLEGARQLKVAGGTVFAQDEASCVVYGMPKAVVEAGLTDAIIELSDIPEALLRATGRTTDRIS